MSRHLRNLLFMGMLFTLTACASSPIIEKASDKQYAAVIDEFEDHFSYDVISQMELKNVCTAYLTLRNYKGYSTCMNHLLDRKDILATRWSVFPAYPYEDFICLEYYGAMSQMYMDTGQYEKALRYAKESKRIFSETHPDAIPDKDGKYKLLTANFDYLESIGRIAHAYALLGDRQHAESCLKEINELELVGRYDQINHGRVKAIWTAKVRIALKDYDKALDAIKQANLVQSDSTKNIASSLAGTVLTGAAIVAAPLVAPVAVMAAVPLLGFSTHLGESVANKEYIDNFKANLVLFWGAKCSFETGKYDVARASYDQLLSAPDVTTYASIYPTILHDRGRIALIDGDEKLAENDFTKSIDAIESYRSNVADDTSKIGFVSDKTAVYGDMVALLVNQQRYDEAFVYAERAKARALVDMLASRQQFKARKDAGTMVAQLDDAEFDAAALLPLEEGNPKRDLLVTRKQTIRTKAPEVASLVTVDAPDAARLAKLLPENETMLEYYGNGDTLYAFVMTADGIGAIELDGKGLSNDVTTFREALTDPFSDAYVKSSQMLYSRLIAPVEKQFKGSRLTIVPHGPLHYLPFAALTSESRFMVDKYAIRLLSSASVMEYLKNRDGLPESLLAFGNPDLGDPSLSLPGAQQEVVAISREIKGTIMMVGKQATKDVLEQHGADFKYLHFATHGSFNADKPLDSGLFLAGANPQSGMLTVGELYDIPLNADLVTLSACETGLGKVSNGDDVIGLNRGFLFAGASTIVSSLWQVDDRATALLMENMYAELKQTNKLDALRNAQRKVKEAYNRHPYYWAAFQLTGNE